MSDVNATVIVCDDLRMEINGKLFFIGMYPAHIVIPGEELQIQKLVFFFNADFPITHIPKKIRYEVALPGEKAHPSEMEPNPPEFRKEHTRFITRHAITFVNPILRLGKIGAKLIVDDGEEISVAAGWVQNPSEPPPTAPSA